MLIVADDRDSIGAALLATLERAGFSGIAMRLGEVYDWLAGASDADIAAIDAFFIGSGNHRLEHVKAIKSRYCGPIVAVCDQRVLDETLELFAAGADDVVTKPVHAREMLARIAAIRRRRHERDDDGECAIRVFEDGRDPVVGSAPLPLPRRELRILECLMSARSAWLTKSRIFGSVYGLCDDRFDEDVVETHICRLRKRLRVRLGYDPIETQRFLGYRLVLRNIPAPEARLAQAASGELVA